MRAVFSQKKYLETSGKKLRRRRIIAILTTLVVCFCFTRLKTADDVLPGGEQVDNSVVVLMLIFALAVAFGFWWILKLRRNSAKESIIDYDGTTIMYDCLHSRDASFVYSEERRCYMIYDCDKIVEDSEKYGFYGKFSYVKKDIHGNVSSHQCDSIFIPKYFDNLDEIVIRFKENKDL